MLNPVRCARGSSWCVHCGSPVLRCGLSGKHSMYGSGFRFHYRIWLDPLEEVANDAGVEVLPGDRYMHASCVTNRLRAIESGRSVPFVASQRHEQLIVCRIDLTDIDESKVDFGSAHSRLSAL